MQTQDGQTDTINQKLSATQKKTHHKQQLQIPQLVEEGTEQFFSFSLLLE